MSDRFEQNASKPAGEKAIYAKKFIVTADQPNIIRLVNSIGFVKFWEAWIVPDEGGKALPFIMGVEDFDGNRSWNILMEIVGDPLNWFKGGILNSIRGEDGKKKYIWEDRAPNAFLIAKWNGDISQASGSWEPRKQYAFNCIPRTLEVDKQTGRSFNWTIENKKTQILSIGQTVFDYLKGIRENYGDTDTFDINIKKTGSGQFNTKYEVYKAEKTTFPIAEVGYLTDAEKAYDTWDLLKECAPTSDDIIFDKLGKQIKVISEAMGIDFIGKLQASVGNRPQVEVSSTNSRLDEDKSISPLDDSAVPSAPAQQVAPVRAARTVAPAPSSEPVKMLPCPHCQKDTPENATECPHCHGIIAGPCSACQKVSHLSLTSCPGCGASFL